MSSDETKDFGVARSAEFGSTRWSIVLKAAQQPSPDSDEALAALCKTYWFPLYAYARSRARDAHEAQDMTQEFFARLLERDYLADADPTRGRFRSFLLTVFQHFLSNEWSKARAKKRGGGKSPLSLGVVSAEARLKLEPADNQTPERIYDRQWAGTLIEHVMTLLEADYARRGKGALFQQLRTFISREESDESYANVASTLGITEGAARVAAHRLRQRYRDLARQEIAETVSNPAEVDGEIKSLFAVFSS